MIYTSQYPSEYHEDNYLQTLSFSLTFCRVMYVLYTHYQFFH